MSFLNICTSHESVPCVLLPEAGRDVKKFRKIFCSSGRLRVALQFALAPWYILMNCK